MIRTVVFDLDGTLLDSARDILAALEAAVADVGIRSDRPLTRALIGPPVAEMLERWGEPLSGEQRDRIVAAFRRAYDGGSMDATHPYDGAAACVAVLRARGLALHVATNKPAGPTARLLARWFPGDFADVVTVDGVPGRRLSKVEMLSELTRRNGLSPATTVIVGDSPSDLHAGRALGWRTVAALHGYSEPAALEAEAPDWRIRSLGELPPLLEGA
jgi:phosphoglycolate phosphatase